MVEEDRELPGYSDLKSIKTTAEAISYNASESWCSKRANTEREYCPLSNQFKSLVKKKKLYFYINNKLWFYEHGLRYDIFQISERFSFIGIKYQYCIS